MAEKQVRKPGFDAYSQQVKKIVEKLPIFEKVHGTKVISAKKIIVDDKKNATVIFVPLRMMRYYRAQFETTVATLEKALGNNVFIIGKRVVAHTKKVGQSGKTEYKPRSRTSKAVHEAYMSEMLYPVEVAGQRTHVTIANKKVNNQKTVFVDVEDKMKQAIKGKLPVFSAVFKGITGERVKFAFPVVA